MAITRRMLLVGGAAAPVAWAVASAADATTVPSWRSHPLTSTRGVILLTGMRAGTARALSGTTVVSTSTIVDGSAILHIPVSAGATRTVKVIAPSYSAWVPVRCNATALHKSPWIFVNKRHRLASTFAPSPLKTVSGYPLRSDAATAYLHMQSAARNAGYELSLTSGYRSYQTQVATYDYWVRVDGKAEADRVSARPGFSEHQTSLAMDVIRPDNYCTLESCFGSTGLGRWIAANCHRFGFIVRYPAGEESVTGYAYEPWHLRYLGGPMSSDYHARHATTLESYFDFPAAPTY